MHVQIVHMIGAHFAIVYNHFTCRRDAAGHDLQGTGCGAIASGNSLVFDASPDRYLV